MKLPTERFSDRVENYVKYRPTYPAKVIDTLRQHCSLDSDAVIADIGAGTGIFTDLLVRRGFQVLAVEPNDEMRNAAEFRFANEPRFRSLAGTSERSGLADGSIDLITVAQAFHWFSLNLMLLI